MSYSHIDAAYQLDELLHNVFGERINTNHIVILQGMVEGTLDNKVFSVTLRSREYLIISTEIMNKEILEEFIPILTEYMGCPPICRYNMQIGTTKEDSLPTIEWDLVNPKERIKEILSGKDTSPNFSFHNVEILDPKYLENQNRLKLKK